ncbi:hypothetical protein HYS50_03705 [Candidatus Woesearchaeota archaeon]|nr:hypothetical protein [Candidatus Woesearchaeota archaeon]
MTMRLLKGTGLLIGIFGIAALGTRGCNMYFNNQVVEKPGCRVVSFATGLIGHVEYVRYADGSQDVKEYPGILGHRLLSSEFHQDLNGDGLVDRIRKHGPEWKVHSFTGLLIREHDYTTHKESFDAADKQLQELMAQYPIK